MMKLGTVLPMLRSPDITRSFRAQVSRRQDFLWMSLLYLFILSIIYVGFAVGHTSTDRTRWEALYNVITVLQFYVFVVVGTLQTAAVFSAEHERNSFDFLLMTPIQRSTIVVGRLFGAPLLAYLLLFLSIPFSFLCFINGGATLGIFCINIVQTLLCGLVFHSWGLLASLIAKKQSNAYVIALFSPLLMLLVLTWTLHSKYLSILVLPIYPITVGNAEVMTDVQNFLGLYVYSFVLSWLVGVAAIYWLLRMSVNLCDTRRQFFATRGQLVGFYATTQLFLLGLCLPLVEASGFIQRRATALFELELLFNMLLILMLHQPREVITEGLARLWKFAATPVNPYRLIGQNVYLINLLTICTIGVVLLAAAGNQVLVGYGYPGGKVGLEWPELLASSSLLFAFTLLYSLLSNFLSMWSLRNDRALLLGLIVMSFAFPIMVFKNDSLSFPLNPFVQFLAADFYRHTDSATRVLQERGLAFASAAALCCLIAYFRSRRLERLMERL